MGGGLGGSAPWTPFVRRGLGVQGGSGGRSPPVYKCTAAQRGSGGLPPVLQVRLVKGKFVAKVRMGGELGVPTRFRPQRPRGGSGLRGACPPVYTMAYKWGSGGLHPALCHRVQGGSGGLAPRFRPQRLELTHFVTGCYFFCGFSCISQPIYTPPKTPFFPTGPASLLVVIRGFPPHIIDTRA